MVGSNIFGDARSSFKLSRSDLAQDLVSPVARIFSTRLRPIFLILAPTLASTSLDHQSTFRTLPPSHQKSKLKKINNQKSLLLHLHNRNSLAAELMQKLLVLVSHLYPIHPEISELDSIQIGRISAFTAALGTWAMTREGQRRSPVY